MHAPPIHIFNRGTKARPNYWLRYSVGGVDVRDPQKCRTMREAEEAKARTRRAFENDTWVHPKLRKQRSANTFGAYAPVVITRRTARGVGRNESPPNKSERGHVEKHLVPLFGDRRLDEMTFKVIRDGFKQIEAKLDDNGLPLAGRTLRNIHATLRTILLEAAEDELIVHVPPPLTARRDHLPPPVDKDPKWRDTAVFTRDEIGKLLALDAVETQYRVMYATYWLTGSRFREILPVRLRDYDRARKPLPSLTIPAAKTRRDKGPAYRVLPVHQELRTWLDWWVSEGYAVLHGGPPTDDAFLFPTLSKRRQKRGEALCSHGEVFKRWQRWHLPQAGLRHRRLHDARRTFISIARSSGADKDLVRAITHKVSADKIMDAYTTWEWDALCREIGKLDWRLPLPPGRQAQVVKIGTRRKR